MHALEVASAWSAHTGEVNSPQVVTAAQKSLGFMEDFWNKKMLRDAGYVPALPRAHAKRKLPFGRSRGVGQPCGEGRTKGISRCSVAAYHAAAAG